MGRKTKKYRADKPPTTADIGSYGDPRAPRGLSWRLSRMGHPAIPSDRKSWPPVTEAALKALLDEIRRNIAADISTFKEDINRVSARLHETEVATAGHETRLTALEWELSMLRHEQAQTQYCMAAMEDRRLCKNVKVRGLSNS
ncbi:Hypothetical predicted protein [Pelobates cultripes]|uniref:Uncharacterized protein n=1 Tax=Pelobates cultripes TaxID=61616 RepID=A0AAD1SUA5_PELCU|nr:Hypothetical predicted protein [Pelobates cultripes]